MKNFAVTNTAGQYLGSIRAKDAVTALRQAIALYGNFFGSDPGVSVA